MKQLVIGTLAHVDAGKTTLNESLLYTGGAIRKLGRVDHQDSFLDYDTQERSRGITIYMKQARFEYHDCSFTMIDTPGHVDFSTEMERTLRVLDYAILVISGSEGVQAHTLTIWNLLKHYNIPVFLFINKMDITHKTKEELMNDIQKQLHSNCIDFTNSDYEEAVALCDENLLNEYLNTNALQLDSVSELIFNRKVFPCFFGSALKLDGIDDLLTGLATFSKEKKYPDEFGAIVYKISKDEKGNRLTHVKITGGSIAVKSILDNGEKIDQIRVYSGTKFDAVNEATAGMICCFKGLEKTQLNDVFGNEKEVSTPMISSYMSYRIHILDKVDNIKGYQMLKELQDEDPQLRISYSQANDEIRIQLMGDVQYEVLQKLILERYKLNVAFDFGKIAYKETIAEKVEGVGHYEPLRHYAEVHILLEPLPIGSGIEVISKCHTDTLTKNYQNQVLSLLDGKEHLGVLTGSPITDIRLTLVSGKAHDKHTEGGDFLQATYRAVRHGLKSTTSILLEPFYEFKIIISPEYISRVTYDLETMHGSFTVNDLDDLVCITGSAPVRFMQGYQTTLASLTRGSGKFTCHFKDYEPCIESEKVIEEINYDSEADIENPTGSVFCKQGAGFYVPWNEVTSYMHLPPYLTKPKAIEPIKPATNRYHVSDEELQKVIERTFGPVKTRLYHEYKRSDDSSSVSIKDVLMPCLLVDGYNIIHSWPALKELASTDLYNARIQLIDYMNNYQGFKNNLLILVFDAYKVKENPGKISKINNIYVVYTKESETADTYIERVTHDLSKKYNITVATSDGMEQLIILGNGANRISARELILDYEKLMEGFRKDYDPELTKSFNMALEDIRKQND